MQARSMAERSLGMLETDRLARGYVCADAMVKTAPVRLVLLAPVSGGRMLVGVDGAVASVEASMAQGLQIAGKELRDALFIADLHPGVPAALGEAATRTVGEALGLVETLTAAAAIRAADAALKTANVSLLRLHLAQGISGKGLLQLTGRVADVEAAVAASRLAVDHPEYLVGSEIIAALHEDLSLWLQRPLLHDTGVFDSPVGG